jgi:hypothetical protein
MNPAAHAAPSLRNPRDAHPHQPGPATSGQYLCAPYPGRFALCVLPFAPDRPKAAKSAHTPFGVRQLDAALVHAVRCDSHHRLVPQREAGAPAEPRRSARGTYQERPKPAMGLCSCALLIDRPKAAKTGNAAPFRSRPCLSVQSVSSVAEEPTPGQNRPFPVIRIHFVFRPTVHRPLPPHPLPCGGFALNRGGRQERQKPVIRHSHFVIRTSPAISSAYCTVSERPQ